MLLLDNEQHIRLVNFFWCSSIKFLLISGASKILFKEKVVSNSSEEFPGMTLAECLLTHKNPFYAPFYKSQASLVKHRNKKLTEKDLP